MNLKVNGREETLEAAPWSVLDLLRMKGQAPETVAVEINLQMIPRSQYAETLLSDGDVIEIVRFVGGGS